MKKMRAKSDCHFWGCAENLKVGGLYCLGFYKLNISLMKMILRPLAGFARYKYPYNINVEENAGYLRKVRRAEDLISQSE